MGCRTAGLNAAGLAALVLAMAGCSGAHPELVPVTGEVYLDGKPVESAAVMFYPEGQGKPAWAHTDGTGTFKLTTYRDKDGAAVGPYKVSVTKVREEVVKPTKPVNSVAAEIEAELSGSKRKREVWLIPQQYADAKASGLAFAVEPSGKNHAVFELTSR